MSRREELETKLSQILTDTGDLDIMAYLINCRLEEIELFKMCDSSGDIPGSRINIAIKVSELRNKGYEPNLTTAALKAMGNNNLIALHELIILGSVIDYPKAIDEAYGNGYDDMARYLQSQDITTLVGLGKCKDPANQYVSTTHSLYPRLIEACKDDSDYPTVVKCISIMNITREQILKSDILYEPLVVANDHNSTNIVEYLTLLGARLLVDKTYKVKY